MPIAEIHLQHPKLPLTRVVETVPDATLSRDGQPAVGDDATYLFFAAAGDLAAVDDALAADPTVTEPYVVADLDVRRVYRVRVTDAALLVAPTLADLGVRGVEVWGDDGGWVHELQLPDRDALVAFRSFCDDADVAFRLDQLYTETAGGPGGPFGLTAAQREALLTAYRTGYFDEPRRSTLADVGRRLGVSPTAAGRRLRRATEALVENGLAPGETPLDPRSRL